MYWASHLPSEDLSLLPPSPYRLKGDHSITEFESWVELKAL